MVKSHLVIRLVVILQNRLRPAEAGKMDDIILQTTNLVKRFPVGRSGTLSMQLMA